RCPFSLPFWWVGIHNRGVLMTAAVQFVLIASLIPAVPAGPAASPEVKQPHGTAQLLANAAGVKPGGSVALAVQFSIEDEWHIYGRASGATGIPTTVNFAVPPGWQVAPLSFPTPIGQPDEFGEPSYVLEGTPALMTSLSAPADAKVGQTVP